MKKVGFVSLGCPKNLVDSEVMMGQLKAAGYEITNNADEAETRRRQYLRVYRIGESRIGRSDSRSDRLRKRTASRNESSSPVVWSNVTATI